MARGDGNGRPVAKDSQPASQLGEGIKDSSGYVELSGH